MSLTTQLYFYIRRLRTHPVQEALAGLGIAVGVALVFAVQVGNGSITAGSDHVVRSIVGVADLQLRARGPNGMPESVAKQVEKLPGVALAAPVLDVGGMVRGANGNDAVVQLASAATSLPNIAGIAKNIEQSHLTPRQENLPELLLPRATAQRLGISVRPTAGISRPAPEVDLFIRGRRYRANVLAVLGHEDVGPLANALAAITTLERLQTIAGLKGRISTVLVQSRPGQEAQVRRELDTVAGDQLSVAPATQDISLLRQATIPSDEATGFFAFVSGLVGLLLAFGAMLLSVPERRRMIADLRIQGTHPRDLAQMMIFQAICLGLIASLLGIVLGDLLSRSIFHQTPGYLALAFPLGTQTVIGWKPVLLSLLGGILATCFAACPPLLDLRRSRAVDAVYFEGGEPGQALGMRARVGLFGAAVLLLAISICLPALGGSSMAVAAIVALAFAALLAIPLVFTAVVWLAERIAALPRGPTTLLMATRTLRATTTRSLALAATGAIAVYGTIAANGAHNDLLKGLYRDYSQYVSTTDLWVTNPKDYLATGAFAPEALPSRIAAIPGVAAVRGYQGGFLDAFGRRIWLIAHSAQTREMVPPGQIVSGNPATAEQRLRAGGWVSVSAQIAEQEHARVGDLITLPTPSGAIAYRIAATTTNLGWSPGAIVINEADYRRAWQASDVSALEVDVDRGTPLPAVRRSIASALGRGGGLHVQSSANRAGEADALAREGLDRLSQIAFLLTAAAVLAMTAAIGASMWQRRPALASLRIQSFRAGQLRAILLWESGLVVGTGCLLGACAGVYGHALIDLYLRSATGFPAPFAAAIPAGLGAIAAIIGATLALLSVPGLIASRVAPGLALQEHG
jgi:putative ABC transport system permease protein